MPPASAPGKLEPRKHAAEVRIDAKACEGLACLVAEHGCGTSEGLAVRPGGRVVRNDNGVVTPISIGAAQRGGKSLIVQRTCKDGASHGPAGYVAVDNGDDRPFRLGQVVQNKFCVAGRRHCPRRKEPLSARSGPKVFHQHNQGKPFSWRNPWGTDGSRSQRGTARLGTETTISTFC